MVQNSFPGPPAPTSWLSVSDISLQEKERFALQNVSFTQQQFQKLAIAGQTGAGKSTLLQIIAGLIQPNAGEVRFEGRRVKGPTEQLMPGHDGISYLSQHYELPKFLRVEQVLRYANKHLSTEAAAALYEVCRISHLALRPTNQLSGGERQRIALARLLMASPKLMLLDEPFSNLDRVHKSILKTVIHDLGEQFGTTFILISHDPTDTLAWADELLVLKEGQVMQRGTPEQVYRQPVDEYTAGLFGDYNLIEGARVGAFAKLAGVRKTGKRLLVRPENVTISQAAPGGLPGKVVAVRFLGSYSEVDVHLLGTTLTARVSEAQVAPGATVYVSFSGAGVWFL